MIFGSQMDKNPIQNLINVWNICWSCFFVTLWLDFGSLLDPFWAPCRSPGHRKSEKWELLVVLYNQWKCFVYLSGKSGESFEAIKRTKVFYNISQIVCWMTCGLIATPKSELTSNQTSKDMSIEHLIKKWPTHKPDWQGHGKRRFLICAMSLVSLLFVPV